MMLSNKKRRPFRGEESAKSLVWMLKVIVIGVGQDCFANAFHKGHSTYVKGMMIIRIAFSCTCHPKRNEAKADRMIARTNMRGWYGCLSRIAKAG